ncbi:MAG: nucleotidyltransferase domain-containing protein [Candidatus Pacearchaeota archaeon]
MTKENSEDQDIPEMNLNKKYTIDKGIPNNTEIQKKTEKAKKELEKLKNFIIKRYPFTEAIGILPPQASRKFIEDELGNIPENKIKELEKKIHLYMIVPEDKFKEIQKIKAEIIKEIDSKKHNVWLQVGTPVDLWEACLDSKFNLVSAISISYPLYDKGILAGLRVAEIHKSLVLKKFDKYIVSYVLGGSLVRGEAVKTSDVDVFVIINDTDVRRMPRLELKERLRGIIHQYIGEATALAGVEKNKLNVQVYLLTDFWESVKDAHPVMFTFIRDGIPIYDKGTFMPWKALLKMGKLKPSPEAIDMFMSMGDKTIKRAKRALLDIFSQDIFWGVTTPAQAIVMLNGLPPPNAKKELVRDFKKEFLDKKMIEKKHVDFLDKIINMWRDYEHEKMKEISGKEIDELLKDTEAFIARMKELRKEIEKKFQEKTIEEIYGNVFSLLKAIIGNKSQAVTIEEFEKLVKTGKFTSNHSKILKDVISARSEFKKGKLNSHKVDVARKNASVLIGDLIEYSQREDLANMEKSRLKLRYTERGKEIFVDLIVGKNKAFLINGSTVQKITTKVENSNKGELAKFLEDQKSTKNLGINPNLFEVVRKQIGDFEIVL